MFRRSAILLSATVLLVVQVAISEAPLKMIPFSADMHFGSSHDTSWAGISGKLYVNSDHMRMETGAGDNLSISITNVANQTVEVLMPARHMYLEQPLHQSRNRRPPGWAYVRPLADPDNPCSDEPGTSCKKVGIEAVNGRSCEHWQITERNGSVSDLWVDQKVHFPVKTVIGYAVWQLTNLHEGEQDAALFQVPSDYKRIGAVTRTAPPPQ